VIRIQNIYYMLSYAFQILKEQGYTKCYAEEFENTADLFAAILVKGISVQIKRGLGKEYISVTEPLYSLRGKIDISESVKTQVIMKHQLVCSYDDFSVDSYLNRILKATVNLLVRYDISKQKKKELRNLMLYFKDVGTIDPCNIDWNIRFNRNNQTYQMLISICYLFIKGLLQTDSKGNMRMQKFLDEQRMCRLFEKFILEYYRREFPNLQVSASQIQWQLDDGISTLLPIMQSDIMLYDGLKTLIIDAKYYSHTMQGQFNSRTLHSNNLYQIFTYVKNQDVGNTGNVAGILLYAKTDEDITPDCDFKMSGNNISVKTLDLNIDFSNIEAQLNGIAESYFGTDVKKEA
jgi:5-methylcytosine-specific restriction enzyme subunit McrC